MPDNEFSRRSFLAGVAVAPPLLAAAAAAPQSAPDGNAASPSTVLDVDFRKLVSCADLTYDKPVTRPEEGMPVGNGRMGSLVWTTPAALHFQINRCDVHAMDGATNSFPHPDWDYSSGCGYVDIELAGFGNDVFTAPAFRQQLTVYDGLMTAKGAGVTARVFAWNDRDVMAVEIDDQRSQPDAIAIDLRMLRHALRLKATRNFEYAERREVVVETAAHTAASRLEIRDGRIALTQQFREDAFYDSSAVVIAAAGRRSKARFVNDSTVRLWIAPGKGKLTVLIATAESRNPSLDTAALATSELDKGLAAGFEGMLATNRAWWRDYWARAFVHLHSADGVADYVEQHYTYFLYIMASSSRGAYPPRFGGMLWFVTGDMRQWGAQHWVHNLGCYYMGLTPANRPELLDPVFRMYSGMYDNCTQAARANWGSKGIWFPETTWFSGPETLPADIASEMQELYLVKKPWDQRSARFMRYAEPKQTFDSVWNWINHAVKVEHGKWPLSDKGRGPFGHVTHIFSSTSKIAYMYWLRYDATRDQAFLRERAYPVLKGAVEFYRNFPNLKKEADGKYHIYHVNNHEGSWDSPDTQEELSGMRSITPLAIRASEILGVDAGMRPVWREFLENIAPLPTNDSVKQRQPGDPVIWVGTGSTEGGRSAPALAPAAYYDMITVATADPEIVRIAKQTYDAANAQTNERTPVNTLSVQGVEAANLGRAEHVRWFIPNQIRRLTPQSDNCDYVGDGRTGVLMNRLGLREGPGDLECQRLGRATHAMHAALLQAAPPAPGGDSVIHVFPAWPKEWDAEYTLLARGAFLVTAAMRRGEIEFVEVKSQAGEKCRLANPWPSQVVTLYRSDKPGADASGPVLEFDTATGEVVVVAPKGTTLAALKRRVEPVRLPLGIWH